MSAYREVTVCARCRGTEKISEWDGMGGFDEVTCPDCEKGVCHTCRKKIQKPFTCCVACADEAGP